MKIKRPKKRRLAGFGAPAHTVRITLGHEDRESQQERITKADVEKAADWIANRYVGVSVFGGRGRYRYTTGPKEGQMANEASTAFDIVALTQYHPSCKKLLREMRGVGKQLARRWNQESAMVTVHCANGPVDVSWPSPRYKAKQRYTEKRRRRSSR